MLASSASPTRKRALPDGAPVMLLHGFPYDVRAYDEVVPIAPVTRLPLSISAVSARLRADALPVGRHAALGRAGGAGARPARTDGRAGDRARGAGRLRLGRARGLHRCGAVAGAGARPGHGRRLQHPGHCRAASRRQPPEQEHRYWYQYYFHTERGRAGLEPDRRELCQLLWQLWSPNWQFDDATYERTAASFDNPDFVRGRHPFLPPSLRTACPAIRPSRRPSGG